MKGNAIKTDVDALKSAREELQVDILSAEVGWWP